MNSQRPHHTLLLLITIISRTSSMLLALHEGEECKREGGVAWTCVDLRQCPQVGDPRTTRPTICSFKGRHPVVCCPPAASPPTANPPEASPPAASPPVVSPPATSSLSVSPPAVSPPATSSLPVSPPAVSPPATSSLSVSPPAASSLSVSPPAVSPNSARSPSVSPNSARSPSVSPPSIKSNGMAIRYCFLQDMDANCGHSSFVKREVTHVVVGGKESKPMIHPHMALLGFGESAATKEWLCGGTLISDRYVLTAAHCKSSNRLGSVKWVRLGELDLSTSSDDARPVDYSVESFTAHPGYDNSTAYNDIALLKTRLRIEFNQWVRPACLQTENFIIARETVATGWGRTDFAGPTSDKLMEVELSIVESDKCGRQLGQSRKMPRGVDSKAMLCAGVDEGGKDTCSGDSGGPLILKVTHSCLKTVVGVTSFGRQCALPNTPGIYTRVSNFIPWIESIVWPVFE